MFTLKKDVDIKLCKSLQLETLSETSITDPFVEDTIRHCTEWQNGEISSIRFSSVKFRISPISPFRPFRRGKKSGKHSRNNREFKSKSAKFS